MAPTRPLNPPPVTVTYQDVVDALHKAVIDKGEDYVYEHPSGIKGCRYFDASGQPSCIVGHALSQWGVAPFGFEEMLNGSGVGNLFAEHVLVDAERAMSDLAARAMSDLEASPAYRTLRSAQQRQDSDVPWGAVLEEALKEGPS